MGMLGCVIKLMLMSHLGENDKSQRQACAGSLFLAGRAALLPFFNAFY
jgi:hypothetical protein